MKCKRCGKSEASLICLSCTNEIQDAERDEQSARIKALELRAEALEAALRPFADAHDQHRDHSGWNYSGQCDGKVGLAVELEDLRAASDALRGPGAGAKEGE